MIRNSIITMRWFLITGFIKHYCSLMIRRNVRPTNNFLIKGYYIYRIHLYGNIDNPDAFGPLNLFYHEENFSEMLVRAKTLIR